MVDRSTWLATEPPGRTNYYSIPSPATLGVFLRVGDYYLKISRGVNNSTKMLIYEGTPRRRARRRRRFVIGSGLLDWIRPVVQAIGAAGRFVAANKDTISNVANVAGNVAKAGATAASSVKQVIDAVRSKNNSRSAKAPERVLSEKSMELLSAMAKAPTTRREDINSRIAGSGIKRILY